MGTNWSRLEELSWDVAAVPTREQKEPNAASCLTL